MNCCFLQTILSSSNFTFAIARKSTRVATNTKLTRRKSLPNSTKATHSKLSSTPSPKASSCNRKIVPRASAKAKKTRGTRQMAKQHVIPRPTAKASRHVNRLIHLQLAALHRRFHRMQAPPARLQRSEHDRFSPHPRSLK